MRIPDYGSYDALGLAQLIAKKKISAREAIEEAIARIEALKLTPPPEDWDGAYALDSK